MGSDSFVREFEQFSVRAGIGMIPSLSSPNSRRTLTKPLWQKQKKKKSGERGKKTACHGLGMTDGFRNTRQNRKE